MSKIHDTVILRKPEQISIGIGTKVSEYVILQGSSSCKIIIGDRCQINPFVVMYAGRGITIGNGVLIGPGVKIMGGNHNYKIYVPFIAGHSISKGPVRIKKDVWVGANSIILSGVTIGTGAVIGAGSVVTKSIPDNEVWVGNPAKFKMKRGDI